MYFNKSYGINPRFGTFNIVNFRSFFFGNYFYGICAVALAIEASLQQGYPLDPFYFYIIIFCATVWFYTLAYISDAKTIGTNARTNWYSKNARFVRWSQRSLLCLFTVACMVLIIRAGKQMKFITPGQWLLIVLFPLVGVFYYGISYKVAKQINLRKVGWLKPFVIGFTWAGIANVYPVIFYGIIHHIETPVHLMNLLLFFKNFMFISVLCIMFDIKDYASDANHQIKTFVVEHGLRHTIFYILLPLSIAGLGSFLFWGYLNHFSAMKMLLNIIPFLCMIMVAYSMHKRKSILYYLVLIDGLMLLKAICGSVAMVCF